MSILYIYNKQNYHYEIIESIISQYNKILNIPVQNTVQIYVSVYKNISFQSYILTKYPNIQFKRPTDYDYYIDCTIYDKNYDTIEHNSVTKVYIAHEITTRLEALSNVYFLTPLAKRYIQMNILPFSNIKVKSKIPIYIIQGHLLRRNLNLLHKILSVDYTYEFKIVLLTRSAMLPELLPYGNKIELKQDLNYINFHMEFTSAYCIIPLITKVSHPQYYTSKLTSSINYASGYNLNCLIDKDLQDIYMLNNVTVFDDETNIVKAFKTTLDNFYKK